MRAFVALNLPDADRQTLHEAARSIREAAGQASWVAPAKLHLTLKFLGDVDEGRIPGIAARLRELAAAHRPMTLDIGGAGVFPNLRAPRIVWLGVGADARLELLGHDIERAFEALGFAMEGRAFRPHITLGRLREPLDAARRGALQDALRASTIKRRIPVQTVDLMASTLGAGGSSYRVLTAAPLGDGEER